MTADSTGYVCPSLRLIPTPTSESSAFWTGGAHGRLMIYHCRDCEHFFHPPGPVCWRCRSVDVTPRQASGRAKVAAYTVNRQPWIPGFDPPYIVAIVELDDEPDVRLTTNVIEVAESDMRVGLPVEVVFEEWPSGDDNDRVWVPLFKPVDDVEAQ